MFSKRRTPAASSKAAHETAQQTSTKQKTSKQAAKEAKAAHKAAEKAAKEAAKEQPAATSDTVSVGTDKRSAKTAERAASSPTYAPGEKPSVFNLAEWSLRRKVALVLAVPVILAGAFGGLRVSTEKAEADNYAATASQVGVVGPAVDYLAAAEHAAVVSRAVGINDPKLDQAQQAVVEAGAKLVEARDRADLTPAQLRQVNDVLSLSEQLRNGMAYTSLTGAVSQVRQLERGVTQIISTIVDEQRRPEPALLVLAQALDGRLSLSLQDIQVANTKTVPINPVELYTELGVEQAAIDRLAISLGQTDPRVLAIRQANAQRQVDARGGDTKVPADDYQGYDELTHDLLGQIDDKLASAARNAKVLTWVDSIIIFGALLAAIILAFFVSRLLLNPIRRVRRGALEVAHERLPEAVAKIRAGEEPGEIVPIGVTTHEETGQLARAVDDLHRQAVKLAAGEAALRAQVGDMFVTLSRRNTSLINQQLGLIEVLERDEEDPQRLESLFRLDHLAARMRRNAESLVILSGAPARVTDQDDLSLTDVLQAAIAGVQDYRRVQLDAAPAQRVSGEAAADVVHLLSELVDNALSYSPPSSKVLVTSSFTRGGVIVQIVDAGLGMDDMALAEVNERLRSGGEVTADTARRMGLFVVSRLSRRHDLTVSIDHNDRQGVTATVFLPTTVLSDTARLEAGSPDGAEVIELGAAPVRLVEDESVEPFSFEAPPEPEPDVEFDPIAAAINAYGLPQRRPGASGAGRATTPAPAGGGFFERIEPDEDAAVPDDDIVDAVLAEDGEEPVEEEHVADVHALHGDQTAEGIGAPEEEERAPIALGPVGGDSDADGWDSADETDHHDEEPAESDESEELDEDVAEYDDEDTYREDADDEHDELAPVLATLPLTPTNPFSLLGAFEPVNTNGSGNGNGNGHGDANGEYDYLQGDSLTAPLRGLDRGHQTPASMADDETPIFRSLRSNWLTADTGERPWADSEVDAGWEAADRVEATPPTRRTETGLPMRRPGNRLIPGGLTTQPVKTVRDPEAIRARLAAHAAGVSRGRTAASEVLTEPTTEEVDPA
jgi:signal transduction histidine kinase